MDSLSKLRLVWKDLDLAARRVRDAHDNGKDPALVYWLLGFALEHLRQAQQELEQAARVIKSGQDERSSP